MSIAKKLKFQDLKKGTASLLKGLVSVVIGGGLIINEFLNYFSSIENKWILWILSSVLVIYGLVKMFTGWVVFQSANQSVGEPFFGLLILLEPKAPLQNDEEKYAFLIDGFYESSLILHDDKESLAELKNNPLHRRELSVQYGDSFALNDFYGIYNEAESTVKSSLSNSWDINSSEEAREQIAALWDGAVEGAEMSLMAYSNAEDLIQSIVELGFDNKDMDAEKINVSGFDLVRTIWVARHSYVAGYIEAEELRAISRNVAAFTAANYANWQELGYSYLVSYLDWLENAKPSFAYNMLKERVYAVSQYLSQQHSPLAGTSLDELRAYFDSLPVGEN
ncbi:hypothetical protein BKG91_04350 [Rodentibacter caecimuris]|uniref:DUF1266 domain-containing protein n=3 Tax=Rodentibacter TaxID=1960084 RepID=A0AAJ3K611_9PAST|nr:DUF1266 domain-containing protein [Rodentibacter heylii]AOF52311.1 hypothetical protein AC062_0211 [Pasteurellaceae bacterium NI1060]OOF72156.1 hypothetical protein BKG99_12100 [Rodentibacter heylii]OOF72483.1 hypothetical protein BKG90_04065 [Rodentibacter heylii]OOF75013.1 hypothetical protein BKG91_04350 [Rodentibacter heylii]